MSRLCLIGVNEMAKPLFDQEALISAFESATAKGREQLRKTTADATLQALKSREMTLKNVRAALQSVGEAVSQGAMRNVKAKVDPQDLIDRAVAGMDDAMLRAVEAHRTALNQLASQGADMREKTLAKAVEELDKFEDAMFAAWKKAAEKASASLPQAPAMPQMPGAEALAQAWAPVLDKFKTQGTQAGTQASATAQDLMAQMQTQMRTTRAASLKAVQAMADSYATLVSGVLMGLSQGMGVEPASAPAPAAAKKAPTSKKA